jgi:hypothetical protein
MQMKKFRVRLFPEKPDSPAQIKANFWASFTGDRKFLELSITNMQIAVAAVGQKFINEEDIKVFVDFCVAGGVERSLAMKFVKLILSQ